MIIIPLEEIETIIKTDLWEAHIFISFEFSNIKCSDINGFHSDYLRKCWFKNGKYHRLDGPAMECSDGYKCWLKNGLVHREDGPAVERGNGRVYWYLEDVWYKTEEDFKKALEK